MRTTFQRAAVVALSLAAVLVAGCEGSSSDDGAQTPGPTPETTTASPPLDGASTDKVTAESSDFGLLTDVRVAGHEGYDRVVFEFADGAMPGYTVEYVDLPITESGSGKEIDMSGATTALSVRFTPASGYDLNAAEPGPTYTGPQELRPSDTTRVVQVVSAGDFEGQLEWAVGLPEEVPFTVTAMDGPARLVIDLQS